LRQDFSLAPGTTFSEPDPSEVLGVVLASLSGLSMPLGGVNPRQTSYLKPETPSWNPRFRFPASLCGLLREKNGHEGLRTPWAFPAWSSNPKRKIFLLFHVLSPEGERRHLLFGSLGPWPSDLSHFFPLCCYRQLPFFFFAVAGGCSP